MHKKTVHPYYFYIFFRTVSYSGTPEIPPLFVVDSLLQAHLDVLSHKWYNFIV